MSLEGRMLFVVSGVVAAVERLTLRLASTLVASVLMVIVALGKATVIKIRPAISNNRRIPPRISSRRKRSKLGMRNFLFFLGLGGSKVLEPGFIASATSGGRSSSMV